MRICGVIASLGAGGAERVMVELCAAWHARGDAVSLLTLDDGRSDFYAAPAGVRRVALDLASASASAAAALRANIRRVRTLRRALRTERPDVIVSFTDRTNVLVLMAARGLGIPVVVSERIDPRRHAIGRAWHLLRRLLYPSAAALVVQTEAVRAWAEAVLPAHRVAVIPNPLRRASVALSPAGTRPSQITGMGRLVAQKGFDVAIDAFGFIATAFPDWQLRIFGEGPDRALLQARIDAGGLGGRITLSGRTSTVDAELAASSVFLLPSRYEGFPNALLEAMAHGCACVATTCDSGPADLITDGVSGRLVPVDDAAALAAALTSLLRDASARSRMGAEAIATTERFAPATVLQAWDRVFASVVTSVVTSVGSPARRAA